VISKSKFILIDYLFIASNENLSVNRIIIRIYNCIRRKIRIIKIDPHLFIIIVRIGPSETVYWLGGPSVSDVLQWDWIFVEARLMKQ
jgi:hypothetical protein